MNAFRLVVGSVLMGLALSCGGTVDEDKLAQGTYGETGGAGDITPIKPIEPCSFICRNGLWNPGIQCLSGRTCLAPADLGCSPDGSSYWSSCP